MYFDKYEISLRYPTFMINQETKLDSREIVALPNISATNLSLYFLPDHSWWRHRSGSGINPYCCLDHIAATSS